MIDAIAGPVSPPPPDVTIPPHVNCEPGWHFVVDDGVCLMLDLQTRAWEASQANCESFGANLVSINSPKKQEEVYTLTGLDPSSTGKRKSKCNFSKVKTALNIRPELVIPPYFIATP